MAMIGVDLQPGRLADLLVAGLSQPEIMNKLIDVSISLDSKKISFVLLAKEMRNNLIIYLMQQKRLRLKEILKVRFREGVTGGWPAARDSG
eukprot:550750-Pelagomonas_calceolata.AAC.1